MIHIDLSKSWKREAETYVDGHAFYQGRYYDGQGLAILLSNLDTPNRWQETVGSLNGSFAVISKIGEYTLAATDQVRSKPIFYSLHQSSLYLSDRADWIRSQLKASSKDDITAAEFLLTGYVTGPDTLYQGIKQIQASEILSFNPEKDPAADRKFYHKYSHGNFLQGQSDNLISKLHDVHEAVFSRLLKSCDGRQLVIPLSAGYDSRLIGLFLKQLGCKDVVCFNYGTPKSWESRIARELAEYLGFKWVHIPYSADKWRQWGKTEEFNAFLRFAGNLCSVPHVQDWPAVYEMHRQGLIAPDCVIVPGHSGDFLAGSHIPASFIDKPKIPRRELLDSLYSAHYNLWNWPDYPRDLKQVFDERLQGQIEVLDDYDSEQAADVSERWNLQERQSKFICNSMRTYEFFDYDWRLPLFDLELMSFWSQIPVGLRYKRRLYMDYAQKYQQLPITPPNQDHSSVISSAINLLERLHIKPLLKKGQNLGKRIFWKREYKDCSYPPLAWFGVLDKAYFRQHYTGRENLHSYMARAYLEQHGKK